MILEYVNSSKNLFLKYHMLEIYIKRTIAKCEHKPKKDEAKVWFKSINHLPKCSVMKINNFLKLLMRKPQNC